MFGYWPDRTDRRLGIDQTKQTNVWVLARPNMPNSGMGQREQTQFRYGPDRAARQKIFPDYELGRPDPLSANQVRLAHTCLRSRTSSWAPHARTSKILGKSREDSEDLAKILETLVWNLHVLGKCRFQTVIFMSSIALFLVYLATFLRLKLWRA